MAVFFFIRCLEAAGLLHVQQVVAGKVKAEGFVFHLHDAFPVGYKTIGKSVVKGSELYAVASSELQQQLVVVVVYSGIFQWNDGSDCFADALAAGSGNLGIRTQHFVANLHTQRAVLQ